MKSTSRRDFIKIVGAGGLATLLPLDLIANSSIESDRWGEILPTSNFGRINEKITILGLGGFHVGRMDDKMAQSTIETAIEGGIRYFDTAESYQQGESEKKYGEFLSPKYRKEVFIMTKTRATDADAARKDLDGSLKRLNTDYIDLWLMHAVNSENDVDNRIDKGVLDVMLKAKQEGKVRHIGFSGHTTPKAHVHLLDRTDEMEAVMMPINVADPSYNSFIVNVLPKLQEKNIGVIAMKTLAGGAFFGRGFEGRHQADDTVMSHISVQEAIHFALSIPNHTLVTGPKDPDMLQEKIDFIHSFKKMNQKTRKQLIDKVAHISKGGIEYYKGIP